MTIVSNGFWSYDLADEVGPPTQIFVTRRLPVAANRPVIHVADASRQTIGPPIGRDRSVVAHRQSRHGHTARLPPERGRVEVAPVDGRAITSNWNSPTGYRRGRRHRLAARVAARRDGDQPVLSRVYAGLGRGREWAQYVADGIYGRVPHEIVGDVLDKIDIRRRDVPDDGRASGVNGRDHNRRRSLGHDPEHFRRRPYQRIPPITGTSR